MSYDLHSTREHSSRIIRRNRPSDGTGARQKDRMAPGKRKHRQQAVSASWLAAPAPARPPLATAAISRPKGPVHEEESRWIDGTTTAGGGGRRPYAAPHQTPRALRYPAPPPPLAVVLARQVYGAVRNTGAGGVHRGMRRVPRAVCHAMRTPRVPSCGTGPREFSRVGGKVGRAHGFRSIARGARTWERWRPGASLRHKGKCGTRAGGQTG